MFLLKLTLAPLLVALATLVARKWGPKAGGVFIGFPLATGPIFLFLAIEQGPVFAEQATVGILLGLVGLAGFAWIYAITSQCVGWIGSLTMAALAYFAVSAGVSQLEISVIWAGVAGYVVLLVVASLIRRPQFVSSIQPAPWWDLWLRMVVAAALTMAITAAATTLGPLYSGILGTYPVVSTVVMTFTHHQWGRDAAVDMLRGSVLSWIAFVSCFLAIGLTLQPVGLAASLFLGLAAALATSYLVLRSDRVLAEYARAKEPAP